MGRRSGCMGMAMSMMTTLFCGEVSRTQMYFSDSMVTWVKVTNCGAMPRLVSCGGQATNDQWVDQWRRSGRDLHEREGVVVLPWAPRAWRWGRWPPPWRRAAVTRSLPASLEREGESAEAASRGASARWRRRGRDLIWGEAATERTSTASGAGKAKRREHYVWAIIKHDNHLRAIKKSWVLRGTTAVNSFILYATSVRFSFNDVKPWLWKVKNTLKSKYVINFFGILMTLDEKTQNKL